MDDNADNHNEEKDLNYFFGFPPFHILWKTLPEIKPFFGKGSFFRNWEDKFQRHRVPITRVMRGQERYTIIMELPGISKDEINLEATSDELWLSARSDDFNKEYHNHLHFRKSIRLKEMKATLKAGILTIIVPYVDKIPKTKVDVE